MIVFSKLLFLPFVKIFSCYYIVSSIVFDSSSYPHLASHMVPATWLSLSRTLWVFYCMRYAEVLPYPVTWQLGMVRRESQNLFTWEENYYESAVLCPWYWNPESFENLKAFHEFCPPVRSSSPKWQEAGFSLYPTSGAHFLCCTNIGVWVWSTAQTLLCVLSNV